MFTKNLKKCLVTLMVSGAIATPLHAEDIDIFLANTAGSAANPNVLIVLDNSSNWAANNQNWPTDASPPVACGNDCNKQGYYELKALRTVLTSLTSSTSDLSMNLGLMMFNNSTATRDGGYIRSHVREMTAANRAALVAKIDAIISNFNTETAASSVQYSAAMWDVFKYFGGFTDPANSTTDLAPSTSPTYSSIPVFGPQFWGSNDADGSKPDPDGYSGVNYSSVNQPGCSRNYVIFIGNGFPAKDDVTSSNMYEVLTKLSDPVNQSPITEFPFTNYATSSSCSVVDNNGTNLNTCTPKLSNYPATITTTSGNSTTTVAYSCIGNGNNVKVNKCTTTFTPSGTSTPSGNAVGRYADEYAKFLYSTDVNGNPGQQNIVTFAIDVYKDQQSLDQTNLMRNMAKYGGGKYFAASNEDAIVNAFRQILVEISAVNTTFASASLPINATNRSQNQNQVFIGTFRPDPDAKPRWYGNLKRYKIGFFGSDIDLADVDGKAAVNPLTGFLTECATSFWTTDSGNYWENILTNPSPASRCLSSTFDKYSDAPDGPMVEKGGTAEVVRKGNSPPTTNTTPTYVENRTIFTASSGGLLTLNATNTGLDETLVKFIRGQDTNDDDGDNSYTETRASIHGDVIHSRPIPINFGTEIVIFYGSNDGHLRAVEAETGKEKWSIVASEFNAKFKRLQDNSPLVKYPNLPAGITPTPTSKDYFWDGSIGVFQNLDNSKVWIFPTMRRGGRMIYGLDVTNPNSPALKWKFGCPNLADDSGCTSGANEIGQTWSLPNVARIKGFSESTPVIVVGGGYDSCEDADTISPACTGAKGRAVYVLNADTGAVLRTFTTLRSVAADVSLVDVDFDGFVDYGNAADTGGNIYRIDFVTPPNPAETNAYSVLAKDDWKFNRVAFTEGDGRKFLFGPALLNAGGQIYVALGSGDREHPLRTNYPFTSVVNRFYVYLDNLNASAANDLDDATLFEDFTSTTTCSTTKVLPGSSKKGWFMNLDQYGKGEQSVTQAVIISGLVIFSTNRPLEPKPGSCESLLGEARGYQINLFNASGAFGSPSANCGLSRSSTFVGGGLPPSPVIGTAQVGDQTLTFVIGGPGVTPISPKEAPKLIKQKRKRMYWHSSGDK
jgi:type IV pilus assembly protein PilY1